MSGSRERICLGVVGAPHGVRGHFRIKTYTEHPSDVAAYGPLTMANGAKLTISIVRPAKGDMVIARAEEISNPEAVKALTGQQLFVARKMLPETDDEDEFYITDLVGLRAEMNNGAPAGEFVAVHDFGAGDLIELKNIPNIKGTRYIRFTKELVPIIDMDGRRIILSDDAFDLGDGEPEPAGE